MKVVIVSKDNFWTQELINNLYFPNIEFIWVSILSEKYIENINPDWIFFFHWSEIVSNNIFEKYKCAVIHTGNLPKDRGGSPIQNQILNRINNTRVNIIEMKETIDSGGVYCSYQI